MTYRKQKLVITGVAGLILLSVLALCPPVAHIRDYKVMRMFGKPSVKRMETVAFAPVDRVLRGSREVENKNTGRYIESYRLDMPVLVVIFTVFAAWSVALLLLPSHTARRFYLLGGILLLLLHLVVNRIDPTWRRYSFALVFMWTHAVFMLSVLLLAAPRPPLRRQYDLPLTLASFACQILGVLWGAAFFLLKDIPLGPGD